MKSLFKLVLVVCLFSSVVFADGEMGTGGKTCTSNCLVANQPDQTKIDQTKSDDSVLDYVQKYLNSMLKYFEF